MEAGSIMDSWAVASKLSQNGLPFEALVTLISLEVELVIYICLAKMRIDLLN